MELADDSVIVRPAAAADEAAWRRLWQAFAVDGPEACAPGSDDYVWRQAMAPESPMGLLLAVARGAPQGFLLYATHPYSWNPREACYLLDLYVVPACRGQGVGRQLIDSLAELGRARDWYKIYWMTQRDNPARHLYDKVGALSPLVRYDLMLQP